MSRRMRAGGGRPWVAASFLSTRRRAVAASWSGPSMPTASRRSSSATPRCRSSAASALRERPRPWCLDSTHAFANAASSIRCASANRPSTASAASSGTPRRRRASASCARVRGAAVSSRRQICLAAASALAALSAAFGAFASASPVPRPRLRGTTCASGYAAGHPGTGRGPGGTGPVGPVGRRGPVGPARPAHPGCGWAGGRGGAGGGSPARSGGALGAVRRRASIRVRPRPDTELLLDLLLDLAGEAGIVAQEVAGVLLALAELVALVGVPGPGLAHDPMLDAEVDEAALPADPDAVEDVELRAPEGRAQLVLHDLDAGPVADGLGAVLESLDPAHVEPHGRVELERLPARGGLWGAEHHADLFPQLVDEDRGGPGLAQRTGDLAERLGHEPCLEADVAVPHLALDLRPRHERGDRVDDDDVDGSRADEHVGDLQRLLPGVRLGDEQRVGVHAELLGVLGVERVLGVDERGDPPGLLRVRDGMQRHRRFPGGFRAVYLHDAPAREAAEAERDVQRDRPGGDHLDGDMPLLAEPNDRALAELPLDLEQSRLKGLIPVAGPVGTWPAVRCHGNSLSGSLRSCPPAPAGGRLCRRYAAPLTFPGRPGTAPRASTAGARGSPPDLVPRSNAVQPGTPRWLPAGPHATTIGELLFDRDPDTPAPPAGG